MSEVYLNFRWQIRWTQNFNLLLLIINSVQLYYKSHTVTFLRVHLFKVTLWASVDRVAHFSTAPSLWSDTRHRCLNGEWPKCGFEWPARRDLSRVNISANCSWFPDAQSGDKISVCLHSKNTFHVICGMQQIQLRLAPNFIAPNRKV